VRTGTPLPKPINRSAYNHRVTGGRRPLAQYRRPSRPYAFEQPVEASGFEALESLGPRNQAPRPCRRGTRSYGSAHAPFGRGTAQKGGTVVSSETKPEIHGRGARVVPRSVNRELAKEQAPRCPEEGGGRDEPRTRNTVFHSSGRNSAIHRPPDRVHRPRCAASLGASSHPHPRAAVCAPDVPSDHDECAVRPRPSPHGSPVSPTAESFVQRYPPSAVRETKRAIARPVIPAMEP